MLALLRTRRWIGFTLLVVGVIIAFGLLSLWQWHRAEERRLERAALQAAAEATPTPLAELDPAASEWRATSVTGSYLPDSGVVVRKRPQDGSNGFWVMTAMRTDGGDTVWVNRGWLAAAQDALSTPDVPPPPTGEVTVIGYLRPLEPADGTENDGLPPGQIAAPATALLPPVTALPAYVQLADSDPAEEDLVPVPLPDIDESRNISYAIQWLLFAAIAMGGWYFFLRREAAEDALTAAAREEH